MARAVQLVVDLLGEPAGLRVRPFPFLDPRWTAEQRMRDARGGRQLAAGSVFGAGV